MPTAPLAVTGSTGVLGGLVARDLAARGVAQRLVVRTPSRAPELRLTTIQQASYGDARASRAALDGVETLFMVSASESPTRLEDHLTFVDAAADAGVRHVVYTSFTGAAPDALFTLARDHFATEEHIRASGMGWTFLRDNFYIDFMEGLVGDDGVIRGPGGDGRAAVVARADIARTAACVLVDPASHLGRTYDLTGPESLSLAEIAATISRVRGRECSYVNETVEEAYVSRASFNVPQWYLDAWVSTYTAIASGVMAPLTPVVEQITGQAPLTLEEFLVEE